MKLSYLVLVVSVLVHQQAPAFAKSCDAAGECVAFFHGSDCQANNLISDYVPTCEGNCFQFSSFDSLSVKGSFFLGTDCHIYSDINCQNQITNTGNVNTGPDCSNTAGAQSMICYYDC
ncbi:hypothetical protein C8F04DRAFT_1063908 [Mycena alexandri]|uniref:Uncharacterized protein n=1 Tax=Mycena alexandri TaxID=1745969 RepID=A0AAD6XFN6_9AGAR|nr:hypothetical protein C8F04DRAFT_1063908 [Mycena alexandri]